MKDKEELDYTLKIPWNINDIMTLTKLMKLPNMHGLSVEEIIVLKVT